MKKRENQPNVAKMGVFGVISGALEGLEITKNGVIRKKRKINYKKVAK